jgi:hypothetical protein
MPAGGEFEPLQRDNYKISKISINSELIFLEGEADKVYSSQPLMYFQHF